MESVAKCFICHVHETKNGPICTKHVGLDKTRFVSEQLVDLANSLAKCANTCSMLSEFLQTGDNDAS